MTARPDNTGREQGGRFRKGRSGNPKGCPTGSRHKATLAAEVLLDGESEKLTRKAIAMALEGDTTALRLCLERILAARRDKTGKHRIAVPQRGRRRSTSDGRDHDGGGRRCIDPERGWRSFVARLRLRQSD